MSVRLIHTALLILTGLQRIPGYRTLQGHGVIVPWITVFTVRSTIQPNSVDQSVSPQYGSDNAPVLKP